MTRLGTNRMKNMFNAYKYGSNFLSLVCKCMQSLNLPVILSEKRHIFQLASLLSEKFHLKKCGGKKKGV